MKNRKTIMQSIHKNMLLVVQHKKQIYTIITAVLIAVILTVQTLAADNSTDDDIWSKAKSLMQDVYSKILFVSTAAAVVTSAVALLMMNFSKNGKTVDESRAWLKRIIITWVILNSLGLIVAYISPLVTGGKWEG